MSSEPWNDERLADLDAVRRADRRFFDALLSADGTALGELLDDAFVIVDVAEGGVTHRDTFLAAVMDRSVRFTRVDVAEGALVRAAGTAAVVVGRTAMEVVLPEGRRLALDSRYTHVFVSVDGTWRLFSAQGTMIAGQR